MGRRTQKVYVAYPPHHINSTIPNLMKQHISQPKPNPVLASNGTFKRYRSSLNIG